MPNTTSLRFPNMFNVAQNRVSVVEDLESVTNRTRLLMLTEPTEVYNEPTFGLGLHRHMWKYNTENERAILRDRLVEQLRLFEPYSIPDETEWADGLMFTGASDSLRSSENSMEMTIAVKATFNGTAKIDFTV